MKEEERFRLHFGPYQTPRVKIGDEIECAARGPVIVAGWSEAPLTWPCCKTTRLAPILCDGLLTALHQESSIAIIHWWGLSRNMVSRWKRTLEIERLTPGTKELLRACIKENITLEVREKALALANRPENIEKRMATRRGEQTFGEKPWTSEEEALLGTDIDRVIAERLGRSQSRVLLRRHLLDIPPFDRKREAYYRTHPDWVVLDTAQLKPRRLALKLTQMQLAPLACMHSVDYSMLERGHRCRIRRERLQNLARALKCKPEDLINKA